jgi:hypothetical protein
MKLRARLILLAVLFCNSCFSVSKWNAAQIGAIRKRAAFVLSCDEEDLEIAIVDRGAGGRVRTLRAVGCDKKATYVIANDEPAAPKWTLDTGNLRAKNEDRRR